jgi:hypothetical protein
MCKLPQRNLDLTHSLGRIVGGCMYNHILCIFEIMIYRKFDLNKYQSITIHTRTAEADLIIPHGRNIII